MSIIEVRQIDFVNCEGFKVMLDEKCALNTTNLDELFVCHNLNDVINLCVEKCQDISSLINKTCVFKIARPDALDVEIAQEIRNPSLLSNHAAEVLSTALDEEALTWGLNHTVGLVSLVALVGIAGISIVALSRCVWNKPVTKI